MQVRLGNMRDRGGMKIKTLNGFVNTDFGTSVDVMSGWRMNKFCEEPCYWRVEMRKKGPMIHQKRMRKVICERKPWRKGRMNE